MAAWVGTDPAFQAPDVTFADAAPRTPTDYATKKVAAELEAASARENERQIPAGVAARQTRAGMGLGVAFGAALAGIAATVAAVLSGVRERR